MKFRNFISQHFSFLLILVILGVLSYGLIIPWLGFYYDDWPFSWIAHRLGSLEFIEAFKPYRPFLGPFFFLTSTLLSEIPWIWHLFSVFTRISLSLSSYWVLKQVWPKQRDKLFWIAVFFLINPGFNQQWVSMTHSNQAFLPHLFQILSFGLMLKIIKKPVNSTMQKISALVLSFIGVFSTEYFISLELLRPIMIWFAINGNENKTKSRILLTIKYYFPYFLILLLNIIWLIYYQSSSSYGSYRISVLSQLFSRPGGFLKNSISDFISSFSLAGFQVWFGLFNQLINLEFTFSAFTGLFLGFISFTFLYFIVIKKPKFDISENHHENDPKNENWALQSMILGGIGILLGKLPSWSIGLPLSTEFPNDRLMMPLLLPSSIFIVGFIEWLIAKNNRKVILYIMITSLAVSHHFMVGNSYRRDWEIQKDFLQQLVWRAPELKKGTLLLTHELPIKYATDNSLSAAINWVYEPENHSRDISIMLAYTKARPGSALLPELQFGTKINYPYRTLRFSSNLDNSLVIYYPTDGCLRVLDPIYTNFEFFPQVPYQLTDSIFISNLSTIISTQISPSPPNFFGKEKSKNWCYYFQKAELARQEKNWREIVNFLHQAELAGFYAENSSEYMVFVEALINLDEIERAREILINHTIENGIPSDGVCYTITRILEDGDSDKRPAIDEFLKEIECNL